MTDSITVKIKKNLLQDVEDSKKYAFYEVEPFNYGDHNYSRIQIEYQNESELEEFAEGKSIKIEVGRDMTKRGGKGVLVISGGAWNADRTAWQKFKDSSKKTSDKIGDTSSKMVKKTGEGLGKAGKNLEESANQDK